MDSSKPGVVTCKKKTGLDGEEKDLRRKIDGIFTSKENVSRIMTDHVETLPPPPVNAEKRSQMYHSIRPYVREEFQNDPLYAKPSEQEEATAIATKQARLAHRAAMATAAKLHQDQRGLSEKHKNGAAVQKKRMATPKKSASTKKHKASAAANQLE
ncbi:unnamed protein product [Phytophthora lilii]|uniref:Unnamed protein product n=1 Tax=Phytophthora lilii TaxID=2077276 RepID=A0A9W6UD98_9STRA|nr:unnamed protein product [Phytophthora lilii]